MPHLLRACQAQEEPRRGSWTAAGGCPLWVLPGPRETRRLAVTYSGQGQRKAGPAGSLLSRCPLLHFWPRWQEQLRDVGVLEITATTIMDHGSEPWFARP